MYDDDATRIPTDENDMWEALWQQFEYLRHVLSELPVETKEDALANSYHLETRGSVYRSGMTVIRYRDTGPELDQRNHYLEMGRELLPYIHQVLDERKLTPQFVQQWGKIMYCHGHIASFVFDDTDDMTNQRKGYRGRKDGQKRWIAHILLSLRDADFEPEEANRITGSFVANLIAKNRYPSGFPAKWFNKMADGEGCLATTYDVHRMYPKRVRELVAEGLDSIPPIPSLEDLRKFVHPK